MLKDKITFLFNTQKKKKGDYAKSISISEQALSNRLRNGAYKARDLVDIASFTETKIVFVNSEGKPVIELDQDDFAN